MSTATASLRLQRFLSRADLESLLNVKERTLRRWVAEEFLPRPFKLNGRNRWRLADIEQFMLRVGGSEEAAASEGKANAGTQPATKRLAQPATTENGLLSPGCPAAERALGTAGGSISQCP